MRLNVLAASGQSNFLVPNATFIVELVIFFVILGVLAKWILPFVQKAMNERQQFIQQQLDESQAARERLEKAEEEYKAAVAKTKAELAEIREQAHADAQRSKNEILAEAREEAARILARTEEQLGAERQRVFEELRTQIGTLAVELAGRIVGEQLSDDALQHRVVERFLAELEQPETAEQVR
ncbi:MAG TPA: F0F1 ATP synthase subunit B [Mycobacteriales bacterium]|nr:F0F1 ATP synthase subunit B [Mycobacteriales bacterium]